MDQDVTLIVFSAGGVRDEVERLVTDSRHAVTADVVALARQTPGIGRIIIATDSPALVETLKPYDVIADYDRALESFSFGARFEQLIRDHDVQRPFYLGGGAGALLTAAEMRGIVERLRAADQIVIPNNIFSSDFVAFTPGEAALGLPPQENDNNLAFLLRTERGLPHQPLPRTVGTQFDIDTPTDVVLLAYSHGLGAHARAFVADAPLNRAPVERLLPQLTRHEPELLVFGRVSGEIWLYFEKNVACRTRLVSEERGLVASGREARGEARSLLGFLFDAHGSQHAFELLSELCTGALIDTRVLLAHRRLKPSAHDRFNADLFRPDAIRDEWLREFTRAAMEAPVPVVLGGHSLVCGGLYLLTEAAWKDYPPPGTDARRS
ncbi:MAG: hypothetical protein HZB53_15685 [Chloroflexi bacterium]|nr:hypothetical protein [Chloroflexota bacterium]